MVTDSYYTLQQPAEAEITIKKSRFIATVAPVEDEEAAEKFIKLISEKHKDATHNVFAYVINEQKQRFSDDGEPSGTAGKPVLEVINRKGLVKTAVVVTRYYGGILLGAGGLVRAYSQAANLGLEKAGIVERVRHQKIIITMDYQWLGLVKREVENCDAKDIKLDYGQQVKLQALVIPPLVPGLISRLTEATAAQITIEQAGFFYV